MERLTKHSEETTHENCICCTHFGSMTCFVRNGDCSRGCPWEEAAWSRLAAYEDTGLMPDDVTDMMAANGNAMAAMAALKSKLRSAQNAADQYAAINETLFDSNQKLGADRKDLINDLCQLCGKYKNAHEGACDGCRWKQ